MRKTSVLKFASNSKKGEEFDSLRLFPLFSRAIVTFPALRHGRFSLFPIEHPRPPADALKDRDGRLPSDRAILKSNPETPMLHKRKERIKMNENVKNLLKEQLWTLGTCSDEPNAVPAFKDVLPDGRLAVGDVFLDTTLKNIEANGKIAVSVYNLATMEGYQIKGHAEYMTEGNWLTPSKKR